MTIVIIGKRLDALSGMSLHVSSLAKSFAGLGHTIHVFSLDNNGNPVKFENYEIGNPSVNYDQAIVNDCDSFEFMFGLVDTNNITRVVHGITKIELDSIQNYPKHRIIAISKNIQDSLAARDIESCFLRNAIYLRPNFKVPAKIKRAVSLMKNPDMNLKLKASLEKLGIEFAEFNNSSDILNTINSFDLVFGIGRSLLDGMSMGKPVISLDRRFYNGQDYEGYGYINKDNMKHAEICNFTGFNNKRIFTEESLAEEIKKVKPEDGLFNRRYIEEHYDSIKIANDYINIAARGL